MALGQLLHQLDELQPGGTQLPLDDILAVALLVFFGLKTINVGSSQNCHDTLFHRKIKMSWPRGLREVCVI